MSVEQAASLLQRKARTGSEAHAARAMSLGRALRLTAAREADRLIGLAVGVLSVTRKPLAAIDVAAQIAAENLTLLMDGPAGQAAAAMLEPVLVTGLIQQQTMGKVMPAPEGAQDRRHTATDAALCAPFIEALLVRASALPEEESDRDLLQGYRFGVWAKQPRQAQLALDAQAYELVEMTLDLAAGARVGKLSLILPEAARVIPPTDVESDAPVVAEQGRNLEKNVLGLKAELTIALTRLKMPIQKIVGFKAGDLLDLQLSSMAQSLVLDQTGKILSRGTLGQIDGKRAVQVEQQKGKHYTQPRRRAADREELDLPDVTAPVSVQDTVPSDAASLPRLSDVDIFGDMDDLPEMPDMEDAAEAADARMTQTEEPEHEGSLKRSVW
ncbi:FliM/FliN family flagellar motor C-terminal domain-containing protein [Sulfitobacter sp. F26169L]|uniref:FliM/FliN family flagellar motor C-terminal domain-containing protein n=1 Tax=Sulfitobacter sp. F26169L TaxID=2996015 RepID=UPI002260CE94|nr:FliM/FliN family flagellar motor C-terminal domain-containing protein [Sulfitobacter sp. F26169L]MCX7565131.1 FliM/FliN family flagellar motor C-terminal domain-containing protein [Sulfitobacter sp. F26169L]